MYEKTRHLACCGVELGWIFPFRPTCPPLQTDPAMPKPVSHGRKKSKNPFAGATGLKRAISLSQRQKDMKQKRKELEEWCRLYAPAGPWDRWVKFQADARIARKEARRRAERERQERQELIVVILCIVGGVAGLAAGIWWLGRNAGKW